jgi:polyisoprenoid-binding protein YceI
VKGDGQGTKLPGAVACIALANVWGGTLVLCRVWRVLACSLVLAMAVCWPGFGGPGPAFAASGAVEVFAIVPASSTASYRVYETVLGRYLFHVVEGTTHAIQGEIAVDRAHPDETVIGPIRVDLRTLATDSRNRDNDLHGRFLQSDKYPMAEFKSTTIYGLPATYPDGREATVVVRGTVAMHGETRSEAFTGTVRLAGNMLTGTLSTPVKMSDYKIDTPTIAGQRLVDDQVLLTVQFVAARESATTH